MSAHARRRPRGAYGLLPEDQLGFDAGGRLLGVAYPL